MSSTDRRIRVAQIEVDLRPYRTGLLERLASRRDLIYTVYSGKAAPGQGSPDELPEVPVDVIPLRNWRWPGQPLKVLWQSGALRVLKSDADVIVCNEVVSNLTVWAVRLLHRRFAKKLVLTGFFYRPDPGPIEPIRSWLRRRLRGSASALIAYTEKGRDQLLSENVEPHRIFVSGNTLDTRRLMNLAAAVSADEADRFRASLGIPKEAVVLAFLGRLRRVKRVDILVDTLRSLSSRNRDRFHLIIIGDGEERRSLEAMAAGLPVYFMGSTYEDVMIAQWLKAASMLVMPGWVGLTCVHGFAHGLPCITADEHVTAQTPEYAYIVDGHNGIIVEDLEPKLFAEAVVALADDENRLSELSAGALETAKRLDMDRMADVFCNAMRHAAEG